MISYQLSSGTSNKRTGIVGTLYGDRGAFDVTSQELNRNRVIVTSSRSIDEVYPPQYAHILSQFGSSAGLLRTKLHTKGPSSAIAFFSHEFFSSSDELVIAAPSDREAVSL